MVAVTSQSQRNVQSNALIVGENKVFRAVFSRECDAVRGDELVKSFREEKDLIVCSENRHTAEWDALMEAPALLGNGGNGWKFDCIEQIYPAPIMRDEEDEF
jgi:hypothetical protein